MNTPERVSRIRLMNKPSCVLTVPVTNVQAIPNRGAMPRTMEITSIVIVSNRPPRPSSGRVARTLLSAPTPTSPLAAAHATLFRLERSVHGLTVFRSERDLLLLRAQLLLHERQRVVARRHALDFKLAVGSGDRIERALHHVDIHLHPRMLVALHRQHNFLAGEVLLESSGLRRLRLIPLAIVGRSRMDIVRGRIAVDDLERLPCHH